MKMAVFASHGGTDLQAIIDGCASGKINATVSIVISNNGDAMALKRAKKAGIKTYHLSSKIIPSEEDLSNKMLSILKKHNIDMIFLAGYMKMLPEKIIFEYHNRIFNIHPALLPKYGGKGMYGINVHKAVIDAHENETGVTIHRVSNEYDRGEIVGQTNVKVMPNDTPEILATRVLEREHTFLVEVISDIAKGKIKLG